MQCLLSYAHKRRRLWITAKIWATFKHLESSLLHLAPTTLCIFFRIWNESLWLCIVFMLFFFIVCFVHLFLFLRFFLMTAFFCVCFFSNERRVRKIWHLYCTYIVYMWNIWVALLVRLLRCAETYRTWWMKWEHCCLIQAAAVMMWLSADNWIKECGTRRCPTGLHELLTDYITCCGVGVVISQEWKRGEHFSDYFHIVYFFHYQFSYMTYLKMRFLTSEQLLLCSPSVL